MFALELSVTVAPHAVAGRQRHRLDFEVGVPAFLAVLTADARALVTAERTAPAGRGAVIDHARARTNPRGHRNPSFQVASEHRPAKAIRRVVRQSHRIVLVVVTDHRDDRTEDLLLRDTHRVVGVDEHRRFDVPTLFEAAWSAATDRQTCPLFDATG